MESSRVYGLRFWLGSAGDVVGQVWEALPILVAIDLLCVVAAIPVGILVAAGEFVGVPVVAALSLGPVWAGAIAVTDRVVSGERVGTWELVLSVRRHAGTGVVVTLAPGVVGTLLLGTLVVWHEHAASRWLGFPLAIDVSLEVVLLTACLCAYTLAVTHSMRGWALWRASLVLLGSNLGRAAGTIFLGVVLLWCLLTVDWHALLLAPGAIALCASFTSRAAIRSTKKWA